MYRSQIGNQRDLYSSKQIELPYPKFVVFYNGTREEPERQILQLRDAFRGEDNKEDAALQCQAVVLNINLGYNSGIMNRCGKLKEYAEFISRVRKYLKDVKTMEKAVDLAVEEIVDLLDMPLEKVKQIRQNQSANL